MSYRRDDGRNTPFLGLWVAKWAQDAESLINLMPAYQMNPDQMGPIVRNTADGKKQLVHARWGLPSPRFALEKAAKAKAEKLAAKGKAFDLEELIRMEAVVTGTARHSGADGGSRLP
jgi:putative SOS response-associated peptidase YedK